MPEGRILVMDDDPEAVNICTRALTREGYHVRGAFGGQEALALLQGETFDLLLADVLMPDIDGITVLRQVRELQPNLISVVITSYGTLDVAVEALRAGARGFIIKPIRLQELRRVVQEALEERQREEERLRLRAQYPIFQVTQAMTVDDNAEGVAQRLLESVVGELGIDWAMLMLLDDRQGKLYVAGTAGLPVEAGEMPGIPLEQGLSWRVLQGRQPLVLSEADSVPHPSWAPMDRVDADLTVLVPLHSGRKAIGLMHFGRLAGGPSFTQSDLNLFTIVATQMATALENARLYEQVRAGRNRLQVLSRRLMELQETERRHLARELHDEVGQILTALKLLLDMGANLPPERAGAYLEEAQGLLSELMERVDNLSLDLRPAMLDDLGLLPALLWHLERYTLQTQIQVNLEHTGVQQRFQPEVETAVYRIVQEALTNVARHAQVQDVTVRLWATDEALVLQVEDCGAGFDPEAALASRTSSGLSGMHERTVLLGGRLTVESTPGHGTRLTADLPLKGRLERRSDDRVDPVGG